jgi:anti-sigma regulatory factor (Ser/Thr protein kinase)
VSTSAAAADEPAPETPGRFVHDVLLYSTEREYLDATVPFLSDSLAAGTPTLVAAPPRNTGWLTRALGPQAEKVHIVDMAIDGRNPNRIIPAVLKSFVDEHAGQAFAIVAEAMWPGRSAAEYPVCVQHEAMVNVVFAGQAGTMICPCDRALEPEVLSDVCRTHPMVIVGGERGPSLRYASPDVVVREFNVPLPRPSQTIPVLDFAGIDDLPRLREFVGRHAGFAGLAHDRSIDLQMAANEIATNTIRHAGGPGAARIWVDDGHVICEISDAGHIADPLAGRLTPPLTSEAGRGLLVINYLCDLVRLHTVPGATTIQMFMRLS